MQKSKGQVELEFLSLVSLVLVIFVIIYFLSFQKQIDVQESRQDIFARQLCSSLAFEIDHANSIGGGYEKNLTLPILLGGKVDYVIDIDVSESSVLISWKNGTCRSFIKAVNISGEFAPGFNTIKNIAGEVIIN